MPAYTIGIVRRGAADPIRTRAPSALPSRRVSLSAIAMADAVVALGQFGYIFGSRNPQFGTDAFECNGFHVIVSWTTIAKMGARRFVRRNPGGTVPSCSEQARLGPCRPRRAHSTRTALLIGCASRV